MKRILFMLIIVSAMVFQAAALFAQNIGNMNSGDTNKLEKLSKQLNSAQSGAAGVLNYVSNPGHFLYVAGFVASLIFVFFSIKAVQSKAGDDIAYRLRGRRGRRGADRERNVRRQTSRGRNRRPRRVAVRETD